MYLTEVNQWPYREVEGKLTSVNCSTGVLEFQFFISKGYTLEFDLPVSLATDRDVGDLAGVCIMIDTTEDGLTAICLRGTETEGEHGRIE